jgi:hypothetical protein
MPHQLENGSDSLPPLPSYNSQPELSTSSRANLNLKRNSSTGPGSSLPGNASPLRQSTLGVPGAKIKRTSAIGVASSHGRLYKVLGDLFLLSGRTEDATVWYAPSDWGTPGCIVYVFAIGTQSPLCFLSLRKMPHGMRQLWKDWQLSP